MNDAKDGDRTSCETGARRRRHRHFVGTVRWLLLLAACGLLPVGPAPAEGWGGASGMIFGVARAVANEAIAISDDSTAGCEPEATVSEGAARATLANEPVVLADVASMVETAVNESEGTALAAADVQDAPSAAQAPEAPSEPADQAAETTEAEIELFEDEAASDLPPAMAARDFTGDSIVKSVRVSSDHALPIRVDQNASVVIDLKVKVDRAEVSNPETADVVVVSPTRLVVTGKTFGSCQMSIWSGEEQRVFSISVEQDLQRLRDMISAMAPNAETRIDSVRGTIVLSGTVPDTDSAQRIEQIAGLFQGGKVHNQLRVGGLQQTVIRVVVAEVNKQAVRQLGVNWAIGASDLSRDFFFANNLNQINPTAFGSTGLANVLMGQQLYGVAPVANGGNTNLTFGFPRIEFQMFVNALRDNNLFRILAEPNLTAISGQTAAFLAGGEVPIPVAQSGAVVGAITILYKEFGVRLNFTPTVMGRQMIRLHVMSEISDAVPGPAVVGGLPVFSFNTRRVTTTIECGNGQTFAIAGLLNERVQAVASKIPGLGDLPVLGALFSSVNYQRNNTEMVVLVTPQLVSPMEPHQVSPPPGSLTQHPNDFELFALQQIEGPTLPAPEYDSAPRDELPVNTRLGSADWSDSAVTLRGAWGVTSGDEGMK